MKINVSKHVSYCSGVKMAIERVIKTVHNNKVKKIYMLGDIVHNPYVVQMLSDMGVIVVYDIEDVDDFNILIIRAHGTTPQIYKRAHEKNLEIVDATCYLVKENQKIVKEMENKGYKVVIIGDKYHDEVISIASFANSPIVIKNTDEVYEYRNNLKKVCVIVQTTEIIQNVKSIIGEIALYAKELNFINTICNPTRVKQEEIIRFAVENDVVFIVGSNKSKNTKNLFLLAKERNERSYLIENKNMIDYKVLNGVNNIAVASGASTPEVLIEEVVEALNLLNVPIIEKAI